MTMTYGIIQLHANFLLFLVSWGSLPLFFLEVPRSKRLERTKMALRAGN
jgi:hypothetical protein